MTAFAQDVEAIKGKEAVNVSSQLVEAARATGKARFRLLLIFSSCAEKAAS